jgi:hypothetical protein
LFRAAVTLSSLVFCSVFAAISRDCKYDALTDSPSRKDSEINRDGDLAEAEQFVTARERDTKLHFFYRIPKEHLSHNRWHGHARFLTFQSSSGYESHREPAE